jgi:hypothetical protein
MRIIRATNVFTDMAGLTAVIARWMRAIADELSRLVKRVTAQVPSHPDIYGLSASRAGSSDAGKPRPNEFESSEHDTAAEAYLPIGPSCC